MRKTLLLLAVILLTTSITTAKKIIETQQTTQITIAEYTNLRQHFQLPPLQTPPPQEPQQLPEPFPEPTPKPQPTHQINFNTLKSTNPEIIAWIEIPTTNISYPILQTTNNHHYLNHTANNTPSNAGAIFLDYRNSKSLTDPHSIIFGHNMRNGTMFAGLHDLETDHFLIHTPEGTLTLKIFNQQTVCQYDMLYVLPNTILKNHKTITLSTCVKNQNELRFIVQGKIQ